MSDFHGKIDTVNCGHFDCPDDMGHTSMGDHAISLTPNKRLVLCPFCYAAVVAHVMTSQINEAVSYAVKSNQMAGRFIRITDA